MRIFSKTMLATLAIAIPFTLSACSDDDNGGGDGDGDGMGGGDGDGDGTGGMSSGTGGNGNGTGGMGGGDGTGGTVEVPVECDYEADGLFCIEDCLATDGPGDRVKDADVGAFTEDKTWMDGWTNWSVNSSGVTADQPEGSADGCDAVVDMTGCTWLGSDIASDMTLTADKVWGLYGKIHVLPGATLTIEPGTVIKGHNSSVGTLVVSRGGKINAEGTKDEPIVFTSTLNDGEKGKAQWGGVIILGQAPNWSGPNAQIEGLADDPLNKHGCDDSCAEDDDSGTMKYVRIEFCGNEIGSGNEINGLTLGSVGSGTSLSYIQVNTTLDDGIEWFGGTVDMDHLVVNNAGDDMFDIDTGYQGTIDTIFGRQVVPSTEDPNGFEWDSDKSSDKEPHTIVDLKNGTMCGTGALGKPNYGMVIRENVRGSIDNLAFMGFDFGIDTREGRFEADGTTPKMTIENSASWYHIDGISNNADETGDDDNDAGFDEGEWFTDGDGNVDLDE